MWTLALKLTISPSLIHTTSGKGAEFTPQGMARDAFERSVELEGFMVMVGSSKEGNR
jgi:hypothetical protein